MVRETPIKVSLRKPFKLSFEGFFVVGILKTPEVGQSDSILIAQSNHNHSNYGLLHRNRIILRNQLKERIRTIKHLINRFSNFI
jgi:hypothetical protein